MWNYACTNFYLCFDDEIILEVFFHSFQIHPVVTTKLLKVKQAMWVKLYTKTKTTTNKYTEKSLKAFNNPQVELSNFK